MCDGTNGTPDLRNSFIVGAGNTYAVGATGGTADAIVVSHTHTATVTDPGHSHGIPRKNALSGSVESYVAGGGGTIIADLPTNTATTGISVSNATAGTSGTGQNLPPYYALAYIQKA